MGMYITRCVDTAGRAIWLSREQAVKKLETVIPLLEQQHLTWYRNQDWCKNIQYSKGSFFNNNEATTCNLFNEIASPIEGNAKADFDTLTKAVKQTPADKVLYRHPLMEGFSPNLFISKLCEKTFAGFALSQIKKARGLNKKIVNPMPKDKKTILDFCYVMTEGKSVDLTKWLVQHQLNQRQIGLAVMPHAMQMYAMYVDDGTYEFSGIMQKDTANQVSLSSIPKGLNPIGYLAFNQMGYSKYCKDYSEYWDWVAQRNEDRYQTTLAHGKQYDAKNMMHTIRLLQTALDIATTGQIIVKRSNRDELLTIKSGQSDYDTLVKMAENLTSQIANAFANSALPDEPKREEVLDLLVLVRSQLYLAD